MASFKFVQIRGAKIKAGIGATDGSIRVVGFINGKNQPLSMNDFGDIGFCTLEPNSSNRENITFTGLTDNGDDSQTLTGVTRGMEFTAPYEEDAGLKKAHAANTPIIVTNNVQQQNGFLDYFNDLANQGAADASTTTKGVTKLSVAPASGSNPIAVGDNDPRVAIPAGLIHSFAGSTAPSGYLLCDGSAVSRQTYDTLFAVIGETYGEGNGSTTFNLPNLSGRVPVGIDSNDTDLDTIGNEYGEKNHQLTVAELARHKHDGIFSSDDYGEEFVDSSSGDVNNEQRINTEDDNVGSRLRTGNTGNDEPHNTMQPSLVVNYIIKT